MYCPKCGRQQAADKENSFCTGCGFKLDAVALQLNGQETPAVAAVPTVAAAPAVVAEAPTKAERFSPRQRGVRLGLLLVVIGLTLVPLAYLLRDHFLDKMIYLLVPAALSILAGVARAAYAALLEEGEPTLSADALRAAAAQLTSSKQERADTPEALPPPRVSLGDIFAEERAAEASKRARRAEQVTKPMRERGAGAA